jgi:hypothetical protein
MWVGERRGGTGITMGDDVRAGALPLLQGAGGIGQDTHAHCQAVVVLV